MFVQLRHGGRVGHPDTSGHVPVGPSTVALPEEIHTPDGRRPAVVPRELTVEKLLAAGADLISLGRGFLANPDLVERLRTGAPLDAVRDQYLTYTGGATGYTDCPTLDEAALAAS